MVSRTFEDIIIRQAITGESAEITALLSDAFEPYKTYYTEQAYTATVSSPQVIEDRIGTPESEVLVALYKCKIVGTVSILILEGEELYLSSMAVAPLFQGTGIGRCLVREIERVAKENHASIISLECFKPLTKAVAFYEHCGFKKTGRTRGYHGITVFEMTKKIRF